MRSFGRTSDFRLPTHKWWKSFKTRTIGMIFGYEWVEKLMTPMGIWRGSDLSDSGGVESVDRWGEDIWCRWGGDEFIVLSAGGSLSEQYYSEAYGLLVGGEQ